jgi:aminoglycoside phosphotransferase (APT) family kinase protein
MASAIETTLGAAIVKQIRAPWGNKNATIIATLSDGRRVVIQNYPNSEAAAWRAKATQLAGSSPLSRVVRIPNVLAQGRNWAAFEYLGGDNAYVAAGPELEGPPWINIARDMGNLAAMLRLVPAPATLSGVWTSPDRLEDAAEEWLSSLAPHLTTRYLNEATAIIRDAPRHLHDEAPVFAHGDFGPQNVLVDAGHVTGLLDFEDARSAHPLLDTAWWVWLVRTHTPAAFDIGWPAYQEGLEMSIADRDPALFTLMTLRLLETADHFRRNSPEKHPSWGRRLSELIDFQHSYNRLA